MKWPWTRKPPSSPVTPDLPQADPDAAKKAQRDAQAQREQVEARNAYVEWLSKNLGSHSEDNHFSELLRRALEGRK